MSRPIIESGGAEVCMLEQSVLVEPIEEEVGFEGVPLLLHFLEHLVH